MINLFVLVTYDVSTSDSDGAKRLRKVAKLCLNYGQRVQNSVFELSIDPARLIKLQHELLKVINIEKDSIRFYYLGDSKKRKVEHFGIKDVPNIEEPIII